MYLSDLLKNIEYISCDATFDPEIREITNNSGEIKAGDVFVCIAGFKTDGHNFALNAQKAGASCIIASEKIDVSVPVIYVENTRKALAQSSKFIYGDPSKKLKIIGITGTNGKTTTCYLIKNILESAGKVVGLIGTNETVVGNTRIPAMRTTPESYQLNKLFSDMLDMGAQYCVMEVSSHSLDLFRVEGISFTAGGFTNLTHDHLDFHKTMENYFNAKAKLFSMCEFGCVNVDDDWGAKLPQKANGRVITYSVNSPSDNKAENIIFHQGSNEFDLNGTHFTMKIPGLFSVYNGLLAISICYGLGLSYVDIAKGLSDSMGAEGRAQVLNTDTDYKVIIDYAHTPDGLYNILSTLKKFATGRIICVFGAAGERDSVKRPDMGEIVGKYADLAIITADNPINEDLTLICSQVEEGILKTSCPYKIIYDRKNAIIDALTLARKEDIVLLAGKGHETYQLIGDEKVPFSEKNIVLEYLNKN
ncbi:MAG: UDP-N-acetylmuramoyl-L-alanyl-D-glutamate--2,6-diaminopimelate ligase [Clostridia bacterium]|nr:UDP-N-acetylmuramoyl-L-alanyl-D-glutamate--2,6-diaminopimelate ligase [Clostridia bacterium]